MPRYKKKNPLARRGLFDHHCRLLHHCLDGEMMLFDCVTLVAVLAMVISRGLQPGVKID
jgi:hypothetical protein